MQQSGTIVAGTGAATCWQCGQPAQRSKRGFGACGRHCLPTKAERKAAGKPVAAHTARTGGQPRTRGTKQPRKVAAVVLQVVPVLRQNVDAALASILPPVLMPCERAAPMLTAEELAVPVKPTGILTCIRERLPSGRESIVTVYGGPEAPCPRKPSRLSAPDIYGSTLDATCILPAMAEWYRGHADRTVQLNGMGHNLMAQARAAARKAS